MTPRKKKAAPRVKIAGAKEKLKPIVRKIFSKARRKKPIKAILPQEKVTAKLQITPRPKPSPLRGEGRGEGARVARLRQGFGGQVGGQAKEKFAPQGAQPYVRPFPEGILKELPPGYGETKIVLLVRDPWWTHAYWEVSESKKDEMKRVIGLPWGEIKKWLRVYDVTGVQFDGTNAKSFFDVEINDFANNWYINVGHPDKSWCVDLGAKDRSGRFYLIARSNIVTTPRDAVSGLTDEEWMLAEDEFRKMYALSGGFRAGATSPAGAKEKRRMARQEFASGSMASPVRAKPRAEAFWLVVDTELVVYGATEPGAKVTIQGKPISLYKDGTFSVRFALPDGEQTIPVRAVSADEAHERKITPIVIKETK